MRPQNSHNFMLLCTSWSNGAVERLGKEAFKVFRANLSELKMDMIEWPSLVSIVQSALNNSSCPQRGNIVPVTAFTGMEVKTPSSKFIKASRGPSATIKNA